MISTIAIREYDQLQIRDKRDVARKVISKDDALALQSIIMDKEPVFKWGYKKLIAQHWVGTISLKDLNIEIMPKLYGSVSESELRAVLVRMINISHKTSSIWEGTSMVQMEKNSLIETLIATYIELLEIYLSEGMQHSYEKITQNSNFIKGRILFNKQFSKNSLNLTRFWCRYSKFIEDNDINQFFKLCLLEMDKVSRDKQNSENIKFLLSSFDLITTITKEKALIKPIPFNSTNHRAEQVYNYGLMFLNNIFSTLSAGDTAVNIMLFDMNILYELFIYRTFKSLLGNNVIYQMKGYHLIKRPSDNKRFVNLRPDIAIKKPSGTLDIIDTKWKIPKVFSKESDAYQMNAYSTSIPNVERIILLYPRVENVNVIDDYEFLDCTGQRRTLLIRTIDLMKILNWREFIAELRSVIS